MKEFETINFHIILFDQGTIELRSNSYIKRRNIYNTFYMNPSGYIFSYNVIFSFLYSKYALLIDDDRPVRKNIEKYLTHTNFIATSINIMDKYREIYGIILRSSGDGKVNCHNEIIHHRNLGFCIIKEAHIGYYYTNGASIYRTNELKRVEIYSGEYEVAKFFSSTKYRMAYILINDICNTTSNKCNYVIDHIGKNSSLKNRNICSIPLY